VNYDAHSFALFKTTNCYYGWPQEHGSNLAFDVEYPQRIAEREPLTNELPEVRLSPFEVFAIDEHDEWKPSNG